MKADEHHGPRTMTWELRLAIRALQHLAVVSRCWTSRQMALVALRAIGKGINLADDCDDEGWPDPIELADSERPDRLYPGELDNPLGMWGK